MSGFKEILMFWPWPWWDHAFFQWWGVYSLVVCSCYASVTRQFSTLAGCVDGV